MTQRFAGTTVVITGAAGGMGLALAQRFAQEGARLILVDVDADGLRNTGSVLHGQGHTCRTHRVDLAVEAEILQFAERIGREHPRLDVLVNNAGLAYGDLAYGFGSLKQEQWLRLLSINTVAPLLLAQALRPGLARSKGVVLNISSMAGYAPATAYGVTKAALNAMTYGMAQTFAADGIRVNAIAPGLVETPAARTQLPPGTLERIHGQQLLNLHGAADDVAGLCLFLASAEGRFITCEVVSCDGGNRIRGWRG
ncbi:MAG: SDR family NAD(P)-dependent oxidoreductase [Nevskia sp.]|nr:SDR family NAD(P)-dependent oxidoreductase [Nevskia sp.]